MKEAFYQFIWQYRLYYPIAYVASTGETVEIIDPGKINHDSGPDFINAKIKINNQLWAGNIEIHEKSGDWYKHQHDRDIAYDNVILHVVKYYDIPVFRKSRIMIPSIVIQYSPMLESTYEQLIQDQQKQICKIKLSKCDTIYKTQLFEKLAMERFHEKSQYFKNILRINKHHWEESLYQFMFKCAGLGKNAIAFELLSKNIPYTIVLKHVDNTLETEALLLGTAGFLNDLMGDEYYMKLKKEYLHMKTKYQLKELDKSIWKFMRMRPSNFPGIRLAQLSSILKHIRGFIQYINTYTNIKQWHQLLYATTSEYWNNHYHLNKDSKLRAKPTSEVFISLMITNFLLPVIWAWADESGKPELKVSILQQIAEIKAEDNKIIRKYKQHGLIANNVIESQAILQLNHQYCEKNECLKCVFGYILFSNVNKAEDSKKEY